MSVSSPLGQKILVDQVCKWCPLEIRNVLFPVDLLIIPFDDFNLIMGMDWLAEHGVILDCRMKQFYVQKSDDDIVEVKGVRQMLQDLLDRDFIHPSTSHWGALTFFVQKKDGSKLPDIIEKCLRDS
ncbi:Transposon Ty3-I Gag-Pol polyprotein [Gossypium australe]|uniref:Transposon Ty3-I Gag-Pol polyprotein n=1 Tax=Gossypium australe TaxID=47621 RepID=A0A5B6X0Y7_9ROSI|nr:Transposon Ty3-I Gag-Pol polyprotein [Gossypium australe]